MGCAVHLRSNNSEVTYVPIGLPFAVVWRSPVGTVGNGLVAMAISFAAEMFAGTHIHVRELDCPTMSMSCNLCVADSAARASLVSSYQLASQNSLI
jgi:hypothetical protein